MSQFNDILSNAQEIFNPKSPMTHEDHLTNLLTEAEAKLTHFAATLHPSAYAIYDGMRFTKDEGLGEVTPEQFTHFKNAGLKGKQRLARALLAISEALRGSHERLTKEEGDAIYIAEAFLKIPLDRK